MEDERDQKNFGVIMEIMVVNIDQHYFHNVKYFDIFDPIFYSVIYKKVYHVEKYFHCIENFSSCT